MAYNTIHAGRTRITNARYILGNFCGGGKNDFCTIIVQLYKFFKMPISFLPVFLQTEFFVQVFGKKYA